jgi:hypothetical protein
MQVEGTIFSKMLRKIISGGQTGADRAGASAFLDVSPGSRWILCSKDQRTEIKKSAGRPLTHASHAGKSGASNKPGQIR